MQQWSTAQQAGLPGGQFTPELEAMFSRIANLNTLGGDVLQQLRPNLALSEATVSRWMSAPVEAPAHRDWRRRPRQRLVVLRFTKPLALWCDLCRTALYCLRSHA